MVDGTVHVERRRHDVPGPAERGRPSRCSMPRPANGHAAAEGGADGPPGGGAHGGRVAGRRPAWPTRHERSDPNRDESVIPGRRDRCSTVMGTDTALAEYLPVLYRVALDAIDELARRGDRIEAARLRRKAGRAYSHAWDERLPADARGGRRRRPCRRRPAGAGLPCPGMRPALSRLARRVVRLGCGHGLGQTPPRPRRACHRRGTNLADIGEEVEDEWTYVNDLDAAWAARLAALAQRAATSRRPRRRSRRSTRRSPRARRGPTRIARSTGCRPSRKSSSSPSASEAERRADALPGRRPDGRAVVYAAIQADPLVVRAATPSPALVAPPERILARGPS